MLLALYNYATRLLNSMTTTLVAAAVAAAATATATATATSTTGITTYPTLNANTAINNKTATHAMLPEQQQQQQPQESPIAEQLSTSLPPLQPPLLQHSVDTFNATLKMLYNNTLANVASANLSDYTTPYTLLTPLSNSTTAAAAAASNAYNSSIDSATPTLLPALPATRHYIEASTFPAQTVATFIAGNKNRATTIIVYPTVSPESIVIPIVSCIFGFPILALIVICCLRRRAKLARERDRRRNYDMQDHAVSLVRFSPIHRLNYRSSRAISLRPERSLSQGFTSLELDTVVEERCSDVEQTQTEILNAESPMETTSSCKMSFSS